MYSYVVLLRAHTEAGQIGMEKMLSRRGVIKMRSGGETKDKPHPYEQKPKPDTVRKIGETAIKGAQKDKGKK